MRSITIGVFDGVHLGHAYIVKKTVECAQTHHLISMALVFERPYRAVVGEGFEGLLTTPLERKALLVSMGVQEVEVKKLEKMANVEAFDFVSSLIEEFHPKCIHVGHDFRFGKGARGDVKMLEEFGKRMGFSVDVIPKIVKDGNRVSSTLVRRALKIGKPEQAAAYLGRCFQISGSVFRERGLASKLGFPTANIKREEGLIVPKFGVYLVKSSVGKKSLYGLLNIGTRPTVDRKNEVRYEVHFLTDEHLELAGKRLALELISFLREEKEFPTLSDLRTAIAADVEKAKKILSL